MDSRVRDVMDLIFSRFHDELTVALLARHVSLSESHLIPLFLRETGTTPYAAVVTRRMVTASELLCTTHLSVKEIGARVGFANQSHFVRTFQKLYGVGPVAYRRNVRTLAAAPAPHIVTKVLSASDNIRQ
jgi:AraC-like DNA-binding protein